MIGLLTFLPTTAYVPQFFFILTFLYVIIKERRRFLADFSQFYIQPKHHVNWNFLIVLMIILLSTINRLIHWDVPVDLKDVFPYFILLIPTYVIAISFRQIDAKILVWMIAFESVIVLLERMAGVSTFDRNLSGYIVFSSDDLAYFQRPLGLSDSSSVIASKLLLAWILIDFFKLKGHIYMYVKILIGAAILITFNRSVIMSLGVYWVIRQGMHFIKLKYKLENAIFGLIALVMIGGGVIAMIILKGQDLINQLTRNKGTVELTGREYIWIDFIEFIKSNLVYGNSSIKLWLDGYHAHNSYIELIATNGVFIAILYFSLIYRNIKKSNWIYVLPILIFGITQYAFFWGISVTDIVLWVILFGGMHSLNKAQETSSEITSLKV